jgi:hypothetical protein
VPHHRHVVADEHVAQLQFGAECGEQVHDLGANRNVQGGHRLVQQQHPGLDGERSGDAHPLPLAARQLVREPLGQLRREPDQLEQLGDAALALAGIAGQAVHREDLADGSPDPDARIQRRVRVLEDHLNAPALFAKSPPAKRGEVDPVQFDRAGGRVLQPHQQLGEG